MTPALVQRSLARMLANGPMTAVPKRPADQELLGLLAAARFEPRRGYREREVNEMLESWLATFTEPYGIDHVTLRRLLVDLRLLVRTTSGSLYELDEARLAQLEGLRDIDPAQVLSDVRAERERRKRRHFA
ncbi:MAG TPA: DUF2087 domain-containing protein [Usitatibacter sp.]|nr:DUF2087 domain-containing protein [Usitatibacter sp.]